MPDAENRYRLAELAQLTALPVRTLRYYIQKGLVDRPVGETRAAHYTDTHLRQAAEIRKWQDAGLSLERIGELLRGAPAVAPPRAEARPGSVEVWSRVMLADGVELHLDPSRAGLSPEQVRELAAGAARLLQRVSKRGRT